MGHAFGESHPAIAGFLTQQGSDPDVERLLEGFAFLTARIAARADDCVPEMAQELAGLLMPDYVRPLPATTLVQFDVDTGALRGRQSLPRGTAVRARTVDGTACEFRTTAPCEVLPLTLRSSQLEAPQSQVWKLRMQFHIAAGANEAVFHRDGIRVFVGMPYAPACNLWMAVLRHTRNIEVRINDTTQRLPSTAIRCPSFAANHALFDATHMAGERLLHEYFTQPAKFLFFDIADLHTIQSGDARTFEISLTLQDPPELLAPLPANALRLHCVPVVNLFKLSAIPLRRTTITSEALLRADGIDARHCEVYSVDDVRGVVPGTGERRVYLPFETFAHIAPGAAGRYHRVRRSLSPIDGAVDTYLMILQARGATPDADEEEVISVDLTCTNRQLPAKLRHGDLTVLPTVGLPIAVRNIVDMSPPLAPPLGEGLYWRLLAHLGIAHAGSRTATALRERLALLNRQAHAHHTSGRANARRIDAIEEMSLHQVHHLHRGVPVAGVERTLQVAERNFTSRGDAFLFGCALDALFAAELSINSFGALKLRLQPASHDIAWEARIS